MPISSMVRDAGRATQGWFITYHEQPFDLWGSARAEPPVINPGISYSCKQPQDKAWPCFFCVTQQMTPEEEIISLLKSGGAFLMVLMRLPSGSKQTHLQPFLGVFSL